ncbi:hypothetical protein EMPG_11826, partial [Blastomyces silverae]
MTERERQKRKKSFSTADTVTADTEDIVERVKLSRLTNTAEFNLIFLIIIKAAVIS